MPVYHFHQGQEDLGITKARHQCHHFRHRECSRHSCKTYGECISFFLVRNHQVTAAVIPQVTGDLPLQGASSVRKLPHIMGLHLADAHFDEPGRIDLLLGEDVLPEIFLPGEVAGPPGTAKAWNTVFGWALRGAYTPDKPGAKTAPVYVAASSSDQSTDDALSKFWELEEPSKPAVVMTPEERGVQSHFALTHAYVKDVGKYMVSLPRRPGNFTLGESRTQALTRLNAPSSTRAQQISSKQWCRSTWTWDMPDWSAPQSSPPLPQTSPPLPQSASICRCMG